MPQLPRATPKTQIALLVVCHVNAAPKSQHGGSSRLDWCAWLRVQFHLRRIVSTQQRANLLQPIGDGIENHPSASIVMFASGNLAVSTTRLP